MLNMLMQMNNNGPVFEKGYPSYEAVNPVQRTYEVTYPSGQTVQWKNYTITDCLIKFNGHNSMYDYQLKIKELND